MQDSISRKPISHFFVKKQLQIRMIFHIVATVLGTTIIALLSMFIVYIVQFKTVAMYSYDTATGDLDRSGNIIFVILPALLFGALVNIIVAISIGFYASRKYAIPIYKLEQWCSLLLKGKMSALLLFREREEMIELSSKCNELGQFFRERFCAIKRQVEELKKSHADVTAVKKIEAAIEGLDLSTDPIEVNTGYYKAILKQEQTKK
jgi:hypothetical protein